MKNVVKKITVAALTTSLAFGIGTSFVNNKTVGAAADSNKVVVAGSSALLPLVSQAKKEFVKSNPKVKVLVSGSSSIAGPQAVQKGAATIGACDWDATKAAGGFKAFDGLVAYKVSATPFAAIVNKDNSVSDLSSSDLQKIFTGKITNWKQVGGPDHDIVVNNRKIGSGTRLNFQAKALNGEDFMSGGNYKEQASSGSMVSAISSDKYSIGFVDLAYVGGNVKALKLNGVKPSITNVKNGTYKVWAYGYLLTKGNATGANKKFIDYIQSSKFQNNTLSSLKFVPFKQAK
jgi:phosphate transport system substrate-binding protein